MNPALISAATQIANNRAQKKQIEKEAEEQRKTAKKAANLELRNKIVDIALDDEENRKAIAETAREGGKLAIKAAKIGGVLILAGIAGFFAYKGIKKISDKIKDKKEIQNLVNDTDFKNRKLSDSEIATMVEALKEAMSFDNTYFPFYSKSKILSILKNLKTADDWYYLIQKFDKQTAKWDGTPRNLLWFLNKDDNGDVQDYSKLITEKTGIANPLGLSLGSFFNKNKNKKKMKFTKNLKEKIAAFFKKRKAKKAAAINTVGTLAGRKKKKKLKAIKALLAKNNQGNAVVRSVKKSKRKSRLIEKLKERLKNKNANQAVTAQTNTDPDTPVVVSINPA